MQQLSFDDFDLTRISGGQDRFGEFLRELDGLCRQHQIRINGLCFPFHGPFRTNISIAEAFADTADVEHMDRVAAFATALDALQESYYMGVSATWDPFMTDAPEGTMPLVLLAFCWRNPEL